MKMTRSEPDCIGRPTLSRTLVGSTAQQQAPQAPNMTFFVTGAGPGKGADLGGIEGLTGIASNWRNGQVPVAKPGEPI